MALSRIFVDTSAFFAAEVPRDQFYQRSRQTWNEMANSAITIYSSDAIFQETSMLLRYRTGPASAICWIELQMQSKSITWLPIDAEVKRTAIPWMEKFADQAVSFVDATSFVLMRRENIRHIFSFDRHFAAAGFRLWPV
ncbi:MAG: PIN domain-containing protein [Methylacidiphilales bacterium]|nr:PIN domain-containing protein [Candidatus Methylacidiphilales bacterium]